MIFVSIQDFYEKAERCVILTREEEIACALQMKNGEEDAHRRIVESYTPMVARHIKYLKPNMQTLGMAVYCMHALEKAVDSFDFTQDGEPFSHRLNGYLRRASARYIVR